MAQTVQDAKREHIEIVDQLEDMGEEGQNRSWLSVPIALVIIAVLFFLIRRFTSKKEEF